MPFGSDRRQRRRRVAVVGGAAAPAEQHHDVSRPSRSKKQLRLQSRPPRRSPPQQAE